MEQPLWTPSQKRCNETRLADFATVLSERCGKALVNYDDIYDVSIAETSMFWSALWDFADVIGEKGAVHFVDHKDPRKTRFFPDASLNYAENLLRGKGEHPALIFRSETGIRDVWSYDRLRAQVSQLQQALKDFGVIAGDRVAGFLPNFPLAIAAMLAATSLGAVWCSCSPDFGFNGVHDRFGQIEPKIMFTTDGYHYNGKTHDSLDIAAQLGTAIPSIEKVIVLPFDKADPSIEALGNKGIALSEINQSYAPKPLEFTRLPFDAPLYVLFTSGTTGLPKCILHRAGGVLLQHLKEHILQADIRPADKLFFFTTCGWMMWNWLASGLAAGATLILYDGSPFHPSGNVLPDLAEQERLTHFGTSAKYLDACAKANISPAKTHDLSDLRVLMSTGSPLSPDGFDYVYKSWKADICLSSIAGGTDICGCFTGGSPISPVYRGQTQKRQLGMGVQVYDDAGTPVVGEPGELVCEGAHPTLPLGFWNDPEGDRYNDAYFNYFENVWHHGDWVTLTDEGGMVFFGRSDAVLNPGGVRIGTAEIYRQVERIDAVLEALVIGQDWDNDCRVVLFVRLRKGVTLDDALIARIKSDIRTNATPRHVPAKVIAVSDIPRTKSGKITELAVRAIVHNRPIKNTEALANPEALELYRNLAELAE